MKEKEVKIKNAFKHECVDITVECPNCKLEYKEYANNDDDWHIVECDRCGTRYKYRYNWC
jgi:hypothetical protein